MQCNIDPQGVRFRLIWGTMNLIAAAMMAALALWSSWWVVWLISAVCALAGGFALFEARNKWCVLRAMGIKTRI